MDQEEEIIDDGLQTTELEELQAKAEENLKGWQRAVADFENYKRRDEQLHGELVSAAQEKIILDFLDLSEDIDRVLSHVPESAEGLAEWKKGVEGVRKRLQDTFKKLGVEKIPTVGQPFNHETHEALMQVEGEEDGQVAEEVAPGYKRGQRLLKPAQVKVTKKGA